MNRDSGRLRNRAADALVDHRRLVVVVVFATVIAVSAGLVFLEEESGFQEFELGIEEEEKLDYIEQNFSGDVDREIVQVVVRGEEVFGRETLVATLELQQEIRENESVAPTLSDEETAGIANVVATTAIQHRQPDVTDPTLDQQMAALEQLNQPELDLLVRAVLDEDEPTSEALVFVPGEYEPGSTPDSTMVVVFQTVDENYPPAAAPDEVVDSHLAIAEIAEESGLETAVVGSGILTDEEQRALDDTMALVGPAALLLVLFVLVLAYRDFVDVVLGLLGIVLVQLWTFGALGWLGLAFNPVLVAVPVLLIGLSIDYCIHVFMRYRENRWDAGGKPESAGSVDPGIEAAMKAGLASVGAALVWVTVTTALGFLSNLASPVRPVQELGLIAALGIVGSFVVFVLLLPPLKVELDAVLERFEVDRHKRPLGIGSGRVSGVLSIGAGAARNAPVAVVIAVVLLTVLTTVAAANVSTSWGPEDNMVDGAPGWTEHLPGDLQPGEYTARDDLRYVNDHYVRHGSEVELVVEGDITGPNTLRRVAAAEEAAMRQDTVVTLANGEARSVSPLATMERVAREDEDFAETFEQADTTGDGIPDTNLEVLYDELFEVAPDRADEVLHRENRPWDVNGNENGDSEYVALRMAVSVDPEAGGAEIIDQFEEVADEFRYVNDVGDEGAAVTVTGEPIIGFLVQQHLLETLLRSLAITLGAVLVVLMVVFRLAHGSATLGFVTLVPVGFAVSWIIGTMYLLGYPLSVLNAIIASLTIGIGIDYSIHVTERFRDELDGSNGGESPNDGASTGEVTTVGEAITTTVTGTGGALLGSASTTAIGFGVLALAVHPPLQQFGTVTAIMIGYAFLGAVLVLPSLLVLWARYTGAGATVDEVVAPRPKDPLSGE